MFFPPFCHHSCFSARKPLPVYIAELQVGLHRRLLGSELTIKFPHQRANDTVPGTFSLRLENRTPFNKEAQRECQSSGRSVAETICRSGSPVSSFGVHSAGQFRLGPVE